MDSGSTLPSSYSTSHTPSLIRGERTLSNVFEPRYPKWFSYPPINPTEFEKYTPTSTPKGDAIDTTDAFLRRSGAFQDWANKKNAERIQLRYTPDYERLLYVLQQYQYIADQGLDPATRTRARQHMLATRKEMAQERRRFAPAELQHIRDIEKAWVSLVSLESHEREASRQYHASTEVQVDPMRTLSRIERLLGSDGSSSGISSFTQPLCSALQPALSKTSSGGAEVESTHVNGCDPKERLASAGYVSSWPDKPYEILIPDWFFVAQAQGKLKLKGLTVEERFTNLLNSICRLQFFKGEDEYKEKHPNEEGIVQDRTWDKEWHEPSPRWRYEHHRKRGGWWKCRKGPTATAAEIECRACSDDKKPKRPPPSPDPPTPPAEALDKTMGHIEEAMAVVAAYDKDEVLKRIAEEKSKTSSPEALRRQAGENMEIWDFPQDNRISATEPETISSASSSRQPWINYNPLRGVDDSSEAMARSRAY